MAREKPIKTDLKSPTTVAYEKFGGVFFGDDEDNESGEDFAKPNATPAPRRKRSNRLHKEVTNKSDATPVSPSERRNALQHEWDKMLLYIKHNLPPYLGYIALALLFLVITVVCIAYPAAVAGFLAAYGGFILLGVAALGVIALGVRALYRRWRALSPDARLNAAPSDSQAITEQASVDSVSTVSPAPENSMTVNPHTAAHSASSPLPEQKSVGDLTPFVQSTSEKASVKVPVVSAAAPLTADSPIKEASSRTFAKLTSTLNADSDYVFSPQTETQAALKQPLLSATDTRAHSPTETKSELITNAKNDIIKKVLHWYELDAPSQAATQVILVKVLHKVNWQDLNRDQVISALAKKVGNAMYEKWVADNEFGIYLEGHGQVARLFRGKAEVLSVRSLEDSIEALRQPYTPTGAPC